MIGLGLSVVQLAVRQLLGFDPKSLFAASEPGVWYDPSDMSTMFQDSSGTTPVTAVEQPVGLILDKSKGLVLGPELVTNGDFSNGTTGWTATASATLSVVSGRLRVAVAESIGTFGARQVITGLTAGKSYFVSAQLWDITGSGTTGPSLRWANGDVTSGFTVLYNDVATTQNGLVVSGCVVPSGTSITVALIGGGFGGPSTFDYDNISVRELPGNHATQTTATSRPVLSARYNLLTKTEQFDDAAWTKVRSSITQNAATAPDGTATADKLVIDTTAAVNHNTGQNITIVSGTTYTWSVYVKAAEFSQINLRFSAQFPAGNTTFDLSTETKTNFGTVVDSSIDPVGGGWYRCTFTQTANASGTATAQVFLAQGWSITIATGDGTSGIYLWGASLVPANQASLPYQRVNTATDYDADPSKFKPYLRFDGVDDWLVTPTITPGTDKAQVFAGVRKLSDAARGIVAELGNTAGTDAGIFNLNAPVGASASYAYRSAGNPGSSVGLADVTSGYTAPITNVLTGLGDISGDSAILRVNGTQAASSTADQGTGNYLAYPLYIGRRGGTTLPFNGHLYGLIVRFGANLPAGTIASTETWLNQRTGAY